MAAVYVNDYIVGANTGGTTQAIIVDAAVGDVLIVTFCTDPRTGANVPTATCADAGGNTYTEIGRSHDANNGDRAGTVLYVFSTTVVTALVNAAITITLSTSTTPKVMRVARWTGIVETPRSAAVIGGSTAAGTTVAVTSGSANAGDVVMAVAAIEYGALTAVTFDADTTNGSWDGGGLMRVGTSTTGQSLAVQNKIVTGVGTQTWNITHTSALRSYLIVAMQADAPAVQAATAGLAVGLVGSANTSVVGGAGAAALAVGTAGDANAVVVPAEPVTSIRTSGSATATVDQATVAGVVNASASLSIDAVLVAAGQGMLNTYGYLDIATASSASPSQTHSMQGALAIAAPLAAAATIPGAVSDKVGQMWPRGGA